MRNLKKNELVTMSNPNKKYYDIDWLTKFCSHLFFQHLAANECDNYKYDWQWTSRQKIVRHPCVASHLVRGTAQTSKQTHFLPTLSTSQVRCASLDPPLRRRQETKQLKAESSITILAHPCLSLPSLGLWYHHGGSPTNDNHRSCTMASRSR